jgi:hypothetical protein
MTAERPYPQEHCPTCGQARISIVLTTTPARVERHGCSTESCAAEWRLDGQVTERDLAFSHLT